MADPPRLPAPTAAVPQVIIAAPGSFENPTGATIRPQYVERRPPMWAVGDTDLEALTLATNVANGCFAVGSFCLGFAANIFVSYVGVEKLTAIGSFMLHQGTVVSVLAAVVFFGLGGAVQKKKESLWKKIKSESKQITSPQ